MKYDKNYFIKKFEAIPEGKWCVDILRIGEKQCAMGFCMEGDNFESAELNALREIIYPHKTTISNINDGIDPRFQQKTPKQRILAALKTFK